MLKECANTEACMKRRKGSVRRGLNLSHSRSVQQLWGENEDESFRHLKLICAPSENRSCPQHTWNGAGKNLGPSFLERISSQFEIPVWCSFTRLRSFSALIGGASLVSCAWKSQQWSRHTRPQFCRYTTEKTSHYIWKHNGEQDSARGVTPQTEKLQSLPSLIHSCTFPWWMTVSTGLWMRNVSSFSQIRFILSPNKHAFPPKRASTPCVRRARVNTFDIVLRGVCKKKRFVGIQQHHDFIYFFSVHDEQPTSSAPVSCKDRAQIFLCRVHSDGSTLRSQCQTCKQCLRCKTVPFIQVLRNKPAQASVSPFKLFGCPPTRFLLMSSSQWVGTSEKEPWNHPGHFGTMSLWIKSACSSAEWTPLQPYV